MTSNSLPQRVARQIISRIVLGDLKPNQLLPTEEELCEQFGVSRSVIREAMRTVSGVGMTRSHQGRGTIVLDARSWNEFSPEILQVRVEVGATGEFFVDFIELRTILESQAASLAAERAEPSQLDEMRASLRAMEVALDDRDSFVAADLDFHNAIVFAAGNMMIVRLFDLLQPMLRIVRERGYHPDIDGEPRDRQVDVLEHRKVFEHIEEGDAHGAKQAMTEHLRWVARREIADPQRSVKPRADKTARER
ncbi:FadR/GntR family transcriptional regulator [Salinibacterium sp.]|uniref:FadR/GntR family transcriptional regulator n=1 Tax=Salinibacterium sp. TaxID=1915057 RepID=UPI00286A1641|nr:FadR/GntR family transcriptional regulator [Salinibacterium sp.]